jgi:cell division protein YceG involved in septum cleavage
MAKSEDDWMDDPFAADDPAAADRERRRREREERRRRQAGADSAEPPHREPPQFAPPAPSPPSPPPSPPPPSSSGPRPPRDSRARRAVAFTALALAAMVAIVLAGILGYRYLDDEEPPPPPVAMRTITVTIPEGYSRSQTAELARELGLRGDYMEASEGREGFLFPDTFELERRAPVSTLVQLQLEDFQRRVAGVDLRYARSKSLTLRDVVTIASMVEEEAQLESERKLIAAVIYNRLREGIPLGIDATIRFATGNYEEPLSDPELAIDSPYNTRLNAGLPPGPISSPGLASLEAAARPANVDYLYYVVKPGTCGEHAFSTSYAEFEENVARYESARAAAGGESPDTCEE